MYRFHQAIPAAFLLALMIAPASADDGVTYEAQSNFYREDSRLQHYVFGMGHQLGSDDFHALLSEQMQWKQDRDQRCDGRGAGADLYGLIHYLRCATGMDDERLDVLERRYMR